MASIPTTLARREHLAIWLVGGGHLVSHFYQIVLPPLFGAVIATMNVSYAQLGFVLSTYFVATAVTQIPIGMVVDKIGGKPVLVAGLLLHGAAVMLAGVGISYWVLLGAFFFGGVANSVFHPANFTILSSNVRESFHGRAFSVHVFTGSVGYAMAPTVMRALEALLSWQAALISVGAVGVIMALVIIIFGGELRELEALTRHKHSSEKGQQIKRADWRIMLSRPMILFFLFYVCTSASGAGMTGFSVVALPGIYAMSQDLSGTILTVFLIAAIFGSLPGGWLADKTHREVIVLVGCFLIMALALCIIATGILPLWLVFVGMIVAGFMRGLYNASRDILVRRIAPEGSVGTAFAFVTVGYTVGLGTTPVIYGWLMDNDYGNGVFYLSASFALFAIVTVLIPAKKS